MTDLDAAIRAKLDRQRDVMTLDDMFVSDITGNWQDAILAVLDVHKSCSNHCATVRGIAEALEIEP